MDLFYYYFLKEDVIFFPYLIQMKYLMNWKNTIWLPLSVGQQKCKGILLYDHRCSSSQVSFELSRKHGKNLNAG